MQIKIFNINVKLPKLHIVKLVVINFLALLLLLNNGCTSDADKVNSQGKHSTKNLNRSAKYNVQLGLGYLEQGDVERAKDKFLKAIKQSPELPEAHYNLAHFYYLIDEQGLALQHFSQAVSYASSSTSGVLGTAHNNFGVFLCQTKKFHEAEQEFLQAINDEHYADTASAYENAGLCALKEKNKIKAKYYFAKAVKNNPLSQKALIELADLNIANKNYDEAAQYLDRYKQIVAEDKRYLLASLKIAQFKGDKQGANKITKVFLEKYPEEKSSLENNKYVSDKEDKIKLEVSSVDSVGYIQLGKLNTIT